MVQHVNIFRFFPKKNFGPSRRSWTQLRRGFLMRPLLRSQLMHCRRQSTNWCTKVGLKHVMPIPVLHNFLMHCRRQSTNWRTRVAYKTICHPPFMPHLQSTIWCGAYTVLRRRLWSRLLSNVNAPRIGIWALGSSFLFGAWCYQKPCFNCSELHCTLLPHLFEVSYLFAKWTMVQHVNIFRFFPKKIWSESASKTPI